MNDASKVGEQSLWSQQSLIAIREFEKQAKGIDLWQNVCLHDAEMGECSAKSFASPLSLIPDPEQLENLTDD